MRHWHVWKKLSASCLSASLIILVCAVFVLNPFLELGFIKVAEAATVDELNNQIDNWSDRIKAIEKEIEQKKLELQQIGGEKQTLQSAINALELSRKKIETDITKTQAKINSADLTIQKLQLEIGDLTQRENEALLGIEALVRAIQEVQTISPIEAFLADRSVSDMFNSIETKKELTESLNNQIDAVRQIRNDLGLKQQDTVAQKNQLASLKKQLTGQKSSVESTKKEKNSLLTQTQSKEAEYQRVLAEKQAQKAAFEKELFAAESALKIALDPKTYETAEAGSFVWPTDTVRITQYFGKTADSGRLYASGTHNGLDIGVSIGTPIKAVLEGTVTATGNTDGGGCYSYGKWVLIKHANGLSSMYAHLSSIIVSNGEAVKTGQVIAYSGQTGYATGPHLHLTVFATQGMRVQQYTTSINCKQATIPIATPEAYLDPMKYLPAL